MIQDVVARLGESLASQISLIIAFVTFVAVVIWTYTGGRNRFAHEASLPFEDAEQSAPADQNHSLRNCHDTPR